jgi:CRISPR/Cas system CSM-associated protein Csm3 (group 7 of RAMP superfamily)
MLNNNRPKNYGNSNRQRGSRPYDFVYFSDEAPSKNEPPGHHQYLPDHLHGTLFLNLKVQTMLHVSTGAVVMGSDVNRDNIPLIKTMVQGDDKELIIQGSSLKGCIRSIYEAITNSRVGVKPKNSSEYPVNRLPVKTKEEKNKLCPASIVFGASGDNWGWQGLISIQDAHCEMTGFDVGFMPNLWRPRPDENKAYYIKDERGKNQAVGWKFYYNMKNAINKGEGNGIPVQVAYKDDEFITQLNFKNLKTEELGALLITIGQDQNYPIVLKTGAGKPVGMGSMTVEITEAEILQKKADLYSRYTNFAVPENLFLTGESLQNFITDKIQQAHENLIDRPKLEQISKILTLTTNFTPNESY